MKSSITIKLLLYITCSTVAVGSSAIVLTGCDTEESSVPDTGGSNQGGHGHGHDHGDHASGSGQVVSLDTASAANSEIEIAEVSYAGATMSYSLPGTVVPVADNIARVGTILPGRIARLYVKEGSYVSRGTKLAEVETIEIGKVRAEFIEALSKETLARQNFERQQRLAGEQIGAKRVYEAATAEYEQATALREEAEAHMQSLGLDPNHAGNAHTNYFTIRAPISGVVAQRYITLGEYVGPENDMFTLVNTKTVWIDGEATPTQAAFLGIGDRAVVQTPSGGEVAGTVFFVSPTVNPESKKVTVRLEVQNKHGSLRPGTFVTADVVSRSTEKELRIPSSAIEREEGLFFVYKQQAGHDFERVEVEAEEGIDDSMIIRSGLSEGDTVAIAGLFYLRSIRLKDGLSEHDHSH